IGDRWQARGRQRRRAPAAGRAEARRRTAPGGLEISGSAALGRVAAGASGAGGALRATTLRHVRPAGDQAVELAAVDERLDHLVEAHPTLVVVEVGEPRQV